MTSFYAAYLMVGLVIIMTTIVMVPEEWAALIDEAKEEFPDSAWLALLFFIFLVILAWPIALLNSLR